MSKKQPSYGVGHAHPHCLPKTGSGRADPANVHATLGKPPLPKKAFTTNPEIHSGSNAKSKDGTHFHGLSGQDLSRYDANGPDPLAGAPRGKTLTPSAPAFGMRSRQIESSYPPLNPGVADKLLRGAGVDHQLARRIFGEATCSKDDALALSHYGIGKPLPGSVDED